MKFKKFGSKYVIRMEKGEEIVETLKKFCRENNIKLGTVSGLGAVGKVSLGLFHTEKKEYESHEFDGDHEIVSFHANISNMKGEVYLHPHICISDSEFKVQGGHLNKAYISATGEFVLESIEDGEVSREFNKEIGLNLIKFE